MLGKTLARQSTKWMMMQAQQVQQRGMATLKAGDKVGIIGAGLMGHGITQLAADTAKFEVTLVDKNPEALQHGMKAIENSLTKIYGKKLKDEDDKDAKVKAAVEEAMGRITPSDDLKSLAECELVVEAIVENLDIKKSLFKELSSICKPSTVLASNTSSFPINEIASASDRPDKVTCLHFFNPVQLMNLCEVVQAEKTSDETFETAWSFAEAVKRYPVRCKDTPGFIVNRLLVPYLAQSMAMYDRGEASIEDIDAAMMRGAGYPMGPFTLADVVGADTCLAILQGWKDKYPDDPSFFIPKCLQEKVDAGNLGKKSGQGFYKWEGNKKV